MIHINLILFMINSQLSDKLLKDKLDASPPKYLPPRFVVGDKLQQILYNTKGVLSDLETRVEKFD